MKKLSAALLGSRDSFHRPIMGGYACVRVRRLRSESPSRPGGPLRLGRSKSSLVPETHGPCSCSWSQWDAVVYEVRRPRPQGRRRSGAAYTWASPAACPFDANKSSRAAATGDPGRSDPRCRDAPGLSSSGDRGPRECCVAPMVCVERVRPASGSALWTCPLVEASRKKTADSEPFRV